MLAIIVAITAIVLLTHTNFNRSLLVTNTAYAVALSLREAQSLGVAARGFGGQPNAGYGISINETPPMNSYTLFGDSGGATVPSWCPRGDANTPEAKPGNCLFDDTNERVKTYSLGQGFTFTEFCGLTSANTRYCASGSNLTSLERVDIVFLRPNTEAIITGTRGSGHRVQLACAVIWLKAPSQTGASRCVTVSQTGQVAVPQTCPATTLTACP